VRNILLYWIAAVHTTSLSAPVRLSPLFRWSGTRFLTTSKFQRVALTDSTHRWKLFLFTEHRAGATVRYINSCWLLTRWRWHTKQSLHFFHIQFSVSEMTYNVSSGTLNSTIPYHTISKFHYSIYYSRQLDYVGISSFFRRKSCFL